MTPPLPPDRLKTPALRDSIIAEGRKRGASVDEVRAALEAAGFRPKSAPAVDTADATRAVTAGTTQAAPTAGQIAQAFGRGLGRTASLGTIDEAAGVIGGLIDKARGTPLSLADAIRANAEAYRADTAAEQAAPGAAAAGTALGFATPLERVAGVGRVVRGAASLGGRALGGVGRSVGLRPMGFADEALQAGGRLGGEGAAFAALEGAGTAQGGPAERLLAGLQSGVAGGLVNTGVGGVALPVVRGAGRALAPGLMGGADRAAGLLATSVRRDLPPGAPVQEAIGERVGLPFGPVDPARPVAPEFAGRAIADLGENTTALTALAAKTPGPGREQLVNFAEGRQRASADRAVTALQDIAGTDRTAAETVDEIIAARNAEAEPLWGEVYRTSPTVATTEALGPAATGPDAKAAWSEARRLLSREFGVPIEQIPTTLPPELTAREAHYFKLGLDALVERAPSAPLERGGAAAVGQAQLTRQVQDVTARLSDVFPGFREANNAYAGASSLARAAQDGANVFVGKAPSAEALQRQLAAMTDAERDVFRTSALAELGTQIRRLRDGQSKDMPLRSANARAVLDALVPDAAERARVEDLLQTARQQGQTDARILGGSPTAALLSEGDDAATQLAQSVITSPTDPSAWVRGVQATQRRFMGMDDATGEALARLVTAQGGDTRAVGDAIAEALARRAQMEGSVGVNLPKVRRRVSVRTSRLAGRAAANDEE